jgi:hypothetical protein
MKKATASLLGLVAVWGSALPALAANPVPGVYNSTDLGGAVRTGRGTQSWTLPANGAQGLLDVFNSESWNGAFLGDQWKFQCGVQNATQTKQDNRVGGTGTIVYTNTFTGGSFWLSKNGPWGDGVNDWAGTPGSTVAIATVQYVNNVPVASRLNLNSSGVFDGGQCVLVFTIANGIGGGDTDLLPKPAGYPDFLDDSCQPTRSYGSWGDIQQITLQIDCPTPTHSSTWGQLKSIYR